MKKIISLTALFILQAGCSSNGLIKEYNYSMALVEEPTLKFKTLFVGRFKQIYNSLTEKNGPYEILISARPQTDSEYLNCVFYIEKIKISSTNKEFGETIAINRGVQFERGYKNEIAAIYLSEPTFNIPYTDHNLSVYYEIKNCKEKNKKGIINSYNRTDYKEEKKSFWDFATA